MKKITTVTTTRADWNYLLPLITEIDRRADMQCRLLVSGTHLQEEFGYTVRDIQKSGVSVAAKFSTGQGDNGLSSEILAEYVRIFGSEFQKYPPDLLVILGDRMEMAAIALATLPYSIPIAHIAGGDVTEGAVDDAVRHSLTKLSHVHLVSCQESAFRVKQMGEEPWRVHCTGSLGNDCLRNVDLLTKKELSKCFPITNNTHYIVVTFHPETIGKEHTEQHINELLKGLDTAKIPIVFTCPNTDPQYKVILTAIKSYISSHNNSVLVKSAGTQGYLSLIKHASAVAGNSSSGIYDTPYYMVPTVNAGNRQKGRTRAPNVIDCKCERTAVAKALKKALSDSFRNSLDQSCRIWFGDGTAARQIMEAIKNLPEKHVLLQKKFIPACK